MHSSTDEEPVKDPMMKLSAMPPPIAASVKPIRCAECGSKNPGQRKFCGKCGKHLWEPCLRCGESNPSHEEFCGNCGIRLQEALRKNIDAFENRLETAEQLAASYRFHEAMNLLKPVAAAAHSHLAEAAGRAKSRLLFCAREQNDWNAKIRDIEEEIPRLAAAGEIELALRQIRGVPEILRSPGLCETLVDLEKRRAEILDLDRTIFQSGERPAGVELLDKVARLLELQPNHEEASKQSLALKRGAMGQAKACARNGEFEQAWEIVNRMPEPFRDEEFHAFRGQIGDLAYLAWDIGHAPRADKTLVEFARRLRKFLPEDSPMKPSCNELAQGGKDFRPAAPPAPLFGAPLEILRDFGAIRIDECADKAAFAENPGRMAIACGLALQGLGLARLQVNLLPEVSWRGKFGRWLSKRKTQAAWGIEIGASGIKAVKLAATSQQERASVSLADCRIVEHRRRLMQSTNDKERESLLEETLQAFLEQNKIGEYPVVLGLPDWMVLIKTAELPPMPPDKREAAIAHEARHLFPPRLGDVLWKHVRFDDPEDAESQPRPFTVAYVGVRHALLTELLSRWQKSGMRIAAVQCDMAALYNFAMFRRPAEKTEGPAVFLDLGANRLNILACSPRRIWHRSVMFGSDQINKALVREFKLTYAQAEQWKRDPTLAPSIGKYYETLQPIFEIYVEETLASLAAYQKAYPGENFSRIAGCGGGFAAHDLPCYFLWRK